MMNRYEERQEARRERLLARADKLNGLAKAEFRKADLSEEATGIPFGQPILVGHHSERRHRKVIDRAWAAMGRAVAADKAATETARRADAVGTAGISSDDPDAPDKLAEKLAGLKTLQERMIAANKIVRKFKGEQHNGMMALEQAGFLAGQAQRLFTPDFAGRLGFPSYALTNNGANIRRIEARIATLARNAKREPKETLHNSGVRMVENVDDNRLQLFFPGKPASEVRDKLKRAGFRWAPTEGAWQRMLSNGAVWQAQQILQELVA